MGSAKNMPETHVEDASPHVLPPDVNNEMSMSIWDTIKANPKTIGWCCTLASGPMVYGFDLIIVSQVVAMPAFQYVSPICSLPSRVALSRTTKRKLTDWLIFQEEFWNSRRRKIHHPFDVARPLELHDSSRCHGWSSRLWWYLRSLR